MKKKLSRKITFFILLILLLVISIMALFSYQFFKSFYKEQLANEVHEELLGYTKMIEVGINENIVSYIVVEKNQERNLHMVYFNEELNPVHYSENINLEWIQQYESWIDQQKGLGGNTQFVDTGIGTHIPHIWAYKPIYQDGQLTGYFFIDMDTGDFEKAKQQLSFLLLAMGLFTLLIGILLTLYLTKVISKPLIRIGESTRKIAKGDFDIKLSISSDDEIGQLANDIRAMTKQLKEFRDSRRQFISNISHDLRTPITYIKGYSAIMKDSSAIEENDIQHNLDVIYNEAKRMEYLVSDLFQLTKLEEGKISLHKEPTMIVPWLETIVESRQLMLDNQSLNCKVSTNNLDIIVSIDQQRLGQAIINLLENSIRYTPKNGYIDICVSEEKDKVIIEIRDTGIGINKEDLPYIWERFYRVDKSRSRASGGSGLGLAIVKEIIEIHNATITVDSVEGKGTTFYIKIPKE